MEVSLAILVGFFFTVSIYLLMSKYIIRILLGVAIFGNAIHLSIFTSGRLTREIPPIIPHGSTLPQEAIANPLPQALILTAIVISFSFFSFLLVLGFRAFQDLNTDDTESMRFAEPKEQPAPPQGY